MNDLPELRTEAGRVLARYFYGDHDAVNLPMHSVHYAIAAIEAEATRTADRPSLRKAAGATLTAIEHVASYPGPVHLSEDTHLTCEPDECYVTELRHAAAALRQALEGEEDEG